MMTLNKAIRGGIDWLSASADAIGKRVFSAVVWFLLFAIGGALMAVFGVFIIFGLGPAMIVAGVLFLLAAFMLLKGMTRA